MAGADAPWKLLRIFFPPTDLSPEQLPFTALAWVFFCVVSMLVAAVLQIARTAPQHLKAWEKNHADASQASIPIEELEQQMSRPRDRFAMAVPSVLIIVGLLGTFIGLSVTLSMAARAVGAGTPAEGMRGLTDALAGMGIKFQASIWGILGSLITRAIVAHRIAGPRRQAALDLLRTARSLRDTEQKKTQEQQVGFLKRLAEHSEKNLDERKEQEVRVTTVLMRGRDENKEGWTRLLDSILSEATSIHELTRAVEDAHAERRAESRLLLDETARMTTLLTTGREESKENWASLQGAVAGVAMSLEAARHRLEASHAEAQAARFAQGRQLLVVSERLEGFGQFKELLNDLKASTGTFATAAEGVTGAAGMLKTEVEQLGHLLKTFEATSTKLQNEGSAAIRKSAESLERNISAALDKLNTDLNTALGTMGGQLSKATDGIRDAAAESVKTVHDGIGTLRGAVDSLSATSTRSGDELSATILKTDKTLNMLKEYVIRLDSAVDKLAEDKATSVFMLERMKGHIEDLAGASKTSANRFLEAVERQTPVVDSLSNAVTKQIDLVAQLAAAAEDIRAVVAQSGSAQGSMEVQVRQLSKHGELAANRLVAIDENSRDALDGLRGAASQLQELMREQHQQLTNTLSQLNLTAPLAVSVEGATEATGQAASASTERGLIAGSETTA